MSDAERLALVVHELRSPVAALGALAAAAGDLSADGLSRAAELATAAGRDIDRLLSEADMLSLRSEEVELGALLESLVQPGVTCSAEPVVVVCDPTRIRQVLGNLVANGLRHGTEVTVVGTQRDGQVVVEVADNGPGLPDGVDIFDRGVSGVGSSGYGLWLVRAIAEAHGGALAAESTPAGATFTLSVPSRRAASD